VESCARFLNPKKILAVRKKLHDNNLDRLELSGVVQPYTSYAKMYNLSPFLFILYLFWKKMIVSFTLKTDLFLRQCRNGISFNPGKA
jgi:hypothetical protein